MTAPRPTREQVDYELARVNDEYVCSDDRHRLLTAEICALRNELDAARVASEQIAEWRSAELAELERLRARVAELDTPAGDGEEWDEAADADRRQALAAALRQRDALADEVENLRARVTEQDRHLQVWQRGYQETSDAARVEIERLRGQLDDALLRAAGYAVVEDNGSR